MSSHISNIQKQALDGGVYRITADFTANGETHHLWFNISNAEVDANPDAFLSAMLFPSMKAGGELTITGKISPQFLKSTNQIQSIFHSWYPEFSEIQIYAEITAPALKKASGTGCFFSGGVDSFYSLLKHHEEITHLVFVHGFDIPLSDTVLWETTCNNLTEIADSFGKTLIKVETNLREITDLYGKWGPHHFGAALACIAHLLTPTIGNIYLPSSVAYSELYPWGSHPLVDPLFSTEKCTVVHDGCEVERIDKVEYISQSDIAMQHLRVCYQNHEGKYNCGRCEKCLRTMAELRTVAALDRCKTFEQDLDLDLLQRIELAPEVYFYVEGTLKHLEINNNDPDLKTAMNNLLVKTRTRRSIEQIKADLPSLTGMQEWVHYKNVLFDMIWSTGKSWVVLKTIKSIIKTIILKKG